MNIIICLKPIINPSYMSDAYKEQKSSNAYIVNPGDKVALEIALQLKGILKNSKALALTVGPAGAREVLSLALARGCNRAIHLQDEFFLTSDGYSTALAISKTIKKLTFSLILCGNQSLDTNAGFLPTALAEMMNIPVVNSVIKVEDISKNAVRVWRRLDKGDRQIIDCKLPAVLGIDPLSNESRYVPLFALQQAAKSDIQKLTLSDVGLKQSDLVRERIFVQVLSVMPPKLRSKRVFESDSDSPLSQRLGDLFSGKASKNERKDILQGEDEYLSDCILSYLVKNGLLPKR